jgi:hypothetical protein|tara:strand:- start:1168 stop:2133 length:966 start_codon:yes stop_codon:yes gene_type:complete
MTKYVCLAHRFPAAGIDGVLGVTVQNQDEINEYKKYMMGVIPNQVIHFVRLTSIPDHAKNHLKVGDVVIKFAGLSEKFLDVLRPIKTAYFLSKYKAGEIDWDHAENVRRVSIETQQWEASSDGFQVAICDPDGNLAVLRGKKGTPRRLFSLAYSILQETDHDKKLVSADPFLDRRQTVMEKQRLAWCTMRFIHFYILKHGPVVDSALFYSFKKKIKTHQKAVQNVPKLEIGNKLRLHTRRTRKRSQDFWRRVRVEYLNDPGSLPETLAFVASKRVVRWARVDNDEVEDILNFVEWDEWDEIDDPLHFSNTNPRGSSSSRWN